MSLTKIRLANKKAKREAKRKTQRIKMAKKNLSAKTRTQRMRKMIIEGRREDLAKRQKDLDYINQLTNEVENDQA